MPTAQGQTTATTRSSPIKVLIASGGKEISVRRLKKEQLIVEPKVADGGGNDDSTSVQLHPDAVATIYEATIQALVRSSQNLMKEKERVSNLVKYNDPTPSDDQRQLASINEP